MEETTKKKTESEDSFKRSAAFSDHQTAMVFRRSFPAAISDGACSLSDSSSKSASEYLDMSTFHDFNSPSLLLDDWMMIQNNTDPPPQSQRPPVPEFSETVNTSATPNSYSLSSSSTEAAPENGESKISETVIDEDDELRHGQDKMKTHLKPRKKKNQKRQREPRFAFMTQTEIELLDDGYKWRKYGQKAVKNSHFPRSYYRCTSKSCGVKKRVERSYNDPSIVVTTYEGTHKHPYPPTPRSSFGFSSETAVFSGFNGGAHLLVPQIRPQYRHQTYGLNTTCSCTGNSFPLSPLIQERPFLPDPLMAKDDDLLQDMLSSQMLKEEEYK